MSPVASDVEDDLGNVASHIGPCQSEPVVRGTLDLVFHSFRGIGLAVHQSHQAVVAALCTNAPWANDRGMQGEG